MDLVAFPPVCLPSPGESFEGSDGTIAGENLTRSPTWLNPHTFGSGLGNVTCENHDPFNRALILGHW